jgi:hypothetical protein
MSAHHPGLLHGAPDVLAIVRGTHTTVATIVIIGIGTKTTEVEIHVVKRWGGLDMGIQRRMHSILMAGQPRHCRKPALACSGCPIVTNVDVRLMVSSWH